MLSAWSLFNALRFVGKSIKARYGEPPPAERDDRPAAKRNDLFIAVNCIGAVAYIVYSIVTNTPRTVLGTMGLVALSFPFTFGMIPAVRADTMRWLQWLWQRRGAKRETHRR